MILEIAQIDVKPGTEAEFEAGVKKALPIFRRAKGCRSLTLQRSIEKPVSSAELSVQASTMLLDPKLTVRADGAAGGAAADADVGIPSNPIPITAATTDRIKGTKRDMIISLPVLLGRTWR